MFRVQRYIKFLRLLRLADIKSFYIEESVRTFSASNLMLRIKKQENMLRFRLPNVHLEGFFMLNQAQLAVCLYMYEQSLVHV